MIFDFYLSIFTDSRKAETFNNSGLDRKLQMSLRISLTTPYLVYILSYSTQYIDIGGLFDFLRTKEYGQGEVKSNMPFINIKYLIC